MSAVARVKDAPPRWKLPEGLKGRVTCAVDLLEEAKRPPDFVIDRIAEAGDIILITGVEKDSLKTWLAVKLALARILGESWLGFDVKSGKPGRVLFVSTETRNAPLVRRHISMCIGSEVDAAVASKYLYVIDEPITLIPQVERDRIREKAYASAKVAALKIPSADAERRESMRNSADTIADLAVEHLGQNLDVLEALAVPDTWSLIIIDTLRECLDGEENSSADTRRFMASARELARTCGCVVVIIHHSNKTGAHGEARSARGSGQITAAPDAIMTIDASGEYPTAHFRLRNHEPVEPVGYKLVTEGKAARIEVLAPCAGKANKDGTTEEDVLAVFRAHPEDGVSVTTLRKEVAKAKGLKEGSKANPKTISVHLAALLARGSISECEIAGGRGKPMPGYRLGARGGKVPKKHFNERNTETSGDLGNLFEENDR